MPRSSVRAKLSILTAFLQTANALTNRIHSARLINEPQVKEQKIRFLLAAVESVHHIFLIRALQLAENKVGQKATGFIASPQLDTRKKLNSYLLLINHIVFIIKSPCPLSTNTFGC